MMSLATLSQSPAPPAPKELPPTRMALDAAQGAMAEELFLAGARSYGDEPVVFGQIRRDRGTFYLAVIAVRQGTARKVSALLDRELVKEEQRQGYVRPQAPRAEPPAFVLDAEEADRDAKRRVQKVRGR